MDLHILLTSPAFELSEAELAALPQTALQVFDSELNQALHALEKIRDRLDAALARRYGDAAQAARRQAGKDFGVVHLDDGPLRVTVDLPKRVAWDQDALHRIVGRIRAGGDDPGEYVEVAYKVSEAKYGAWPESIRAVFAPARTVKPGKPAFRLAWLPEGGTR